MYCIPPEQSASFVAKMEDVLDVYALPYNKDCPVICLDEKPYQLLDERRNPIPMKPGSPEKYDNEYERMGTCSIFVMCEPLKGWHYANARDRRTAIDYAHEIKWLLTESPYKHAPKIKLIQDNLNTHTIDSLYKAFPPKEARSYAKRLEFHNTPKHGSWLNIAELTISVLSKQCINRRIASMEELNRELSAWQSEYSGTESVVNWQFATEDARIKLRKLYPVI
jgi:hypothetical protein